MRGEGGGCREFKKTKLTILSSEQSFNFYTYSDRLLKIEIDL